MGLELLWIVLAVEAVLGVHTIRMRRRRVNAWIRAWKEALPKDFVVASKGGGRRRVHLKPAGNRELWVDFLCKDAPYAALGGPKRRGLRHTTRDSMAAVLDPEDAAALDVAGLLASDPLQYRRLEVEIFDHGVRLIVRGGALAIDIADRSDRMRRIVDAMDANEKTPAETLRQIYRSKLSVPRRLSALLALRAINEEEALETARADIGTLPEEDRVWVARHVLRDVDLLEQWVYDETLEPRDAVSLDARHRGAQAHTRARTGSTLPGEGRRDAHLRRGRAQPDLRGSGVRAGSDPRAPGCGRRVSRRAAEGDRAPQARGPRGARLAWVGKRARARAQGDDPHLESEWVPRTPSSASSD